MLAFFAINSCEGPLEEEIFSSFPSEVLPVCFGMVYNVNLEKS